MASIPASLVKGNGNFAKAFVSGDEEFPEELEKQIRMNHDLLTSVEGCQIYGNDDDGNDQDRKPQQQTEYVDFNVNYQD